MRPSRIFYSLLLPVLCRLSTRHHKSSVLVSAAKHDYTTLVNGRLVVGASILASDITRQDKYYEVNTDESITDLRSPLLTAARKGHLTTARVLMSEGRLSRAFIKVLLRPVLYWALSSHNIELVVMMLEKKPSLGLRDDLD